MTKTPTEPHADYYRESASWAADRQDSLRASRRVAWLVACGLGVVAVCEALALAALSPLKTVVPYTLLVDRHTGYVEALQPLTPGKVAPDTALTQSFLVQYVIAREGFDINALQANYQKTVLWSAEGARADYVARMQATNSESPLARYPRNTVVDVRVRSVSPLDPKTAMVRYETTRTDVDGQRQPAEDWVSIIHYRFSNAAMSREDRFLNPLGFQVVQYRKDAETLPTSAPAATAEQPEHIGYRLVTTTYPATSAKQP